MQTLSLTHHNAIATVTLNRPDVRNAFNETTMPNSLRYFSNWIRTIRCAWWCWLPTVRRFAPVPI